MAQLTLRLKRLSSGEQELEIDYESSPDAMAFEHEEDHKAMIRKLLENKGPEELKKLGLGVERETPAKNRDEESSEKTSEPDRLKA